MMSLIDTDHCVMIEGKVHRQPQDADIQHQITNISHELSLQMNKLRLYSNIIVYKRFIFQFEKKQQEITQRRFNLNTIYLHTVLPSIYTHILPDMNF